LWKTTSKSAALYRHLLVTNASITADHPAENKHPRSHMVLCK